MFFLEEHLKKYPNLQSRDALKLCYQGAEGASHLLNNKTEAWRQLKKEFDEVTPEDLPLFESITEEVCRVNLAPWKKEGLPLNWLFNMLASSPGKIQGGEEKFKELLGYVILLADRGLTGFSAADFTDCVKHYGATAVSHSDIYRECYAPAYRVIPSDFLSIFPILREMAKRENGIVAIDGRAAAGKSTAALLLQSATDCALIHTDDFFLPPSLRTDMRLNEIGGNIHYERFVNEVLSNLPAYTDFYYGRYDCAKQKICEQVYVPEREWYVVEGCYSCHPEFLNYADLRVFMTVDGEEQKRRIAKRNPEHYDDFVSKWIPMEEMYFEKYKIMENADLIL